MVIFTRPPYPREQYAFNKRNYTFILAITCVLLLPLAPANSEENKAISFVINNKTDLKLVELKISANKISWNSFSGVSLDVGKSGSYSWNANPEDNCKQYLKGRFDNGSWSSPIEVDFCIKEKIVLTFDD